MPYLKERDREGEPETCNICFGEVEDGEGFEHEDHGLICHDCHEELKEFDEDEGDEFEDGSPGSPGEDAEWE